LQARLWRVVLVCWLVVFDGLIGGGTAWPRTVYNSAVPAVLTLLPEESSTGENGIIQIPFDNGRRQFSNEPARIYQRWQVFHGRPISENYEGKDYLLDTSRLVASIDQLCWVQSTLPPEQRPSLSSAGIELLRDEQDLSQAKGILVDSGYEWVVLHHDRCRRPAVVLQYLDAVFGAGIRFQNGDAAWRLRPED